MAKGEFLTGEALSAQIGKMLKAPKVYAAVAFWGASAPRLVGEVAKREVVIVCNLASGSTNPTAIETMWKGGVQVCEQRQLHAKVILTEQEALVGSANISTNGLGIENSQPAHWFEAGMLIKDIATMDAVRTWFWKQWDGGRPIDQEMLEAAKLIWERRPRTAVTHPLSSSQEFPLLAPYYESKGEVEVSPEATKQKVRKEDVEEGMEIEGPADLAAIRRGRLLLWYAVGDDGKVDLAQRMVWGRLSRIMHKAWRYQSHKGRHRTKWKSIGLIEPVGGLTPIDLHNQAEVDAFVELIERKRFASLRDFSYSGAWYTRERLKSIGDFWKAWDSQRAAKGSATRE